MWGCQGTGCAQAGRSASLVLHSLSQLLTGAKVPAHGGTGPSPCCPDGGAGPATPGRSVSPDSTGPHRQAAGALCPALGEHELQVGHPGRSMERFGPWGLRQGLRGRGANRGPPMGVGGGHRLSLSTLCPPRALIPLPTGCQVVRRVGPSSAPWTPGQAHSPSQRQLYCGLREGGNPPNSLLPSFSCSVPVEP